MLKNHLKIAYRNLLKNKIFSLINILGLAFGIAACLLILQYVSFELSYDDFRNPNIYRISAHGYMQKEEVSKRAQTTPALAPAVKMEIPEVVRSARIVHTAPLMSGPVIQANNRSFHEEKIYFADSSFLPMFSYQLLQGNPEQALTRPNTVVISASMAHKYFPDEEALGQVVTFHQGERGQTQLKITGIFEDIPANSHLHTDFLVSFNSLPWNLDENWGWGNFYNYVELIPGTDPAVVRQKMADVLEKYRGETLAEWRKAGYSRKLDLQPIQSIHLNSNLEAEAETNGSRSMVEFLTLIAFFILLIAWINYLNLTTAKSVERAKEIGIRKVVGSSRRQLIAQFLSESLMVNLLAVLLALTFSQLLMPAFQNLTGAHFSTNFNIEMAAVFMGVFIAGTFLSGLYPALVLSAYQPLQVLNGNMRSSKKAAPLRKALVIFQFAASIALIAGTLAVQRQLHFMRQQHLGIDIEQTLVVKGPGLKDSTYQHHQAYFKNEVSNLPDVQAVAASSAIPGKELSWGREFYPPTQPESRAGINIIAVDEDFFDLYEATFLAGRNFSTDFASDRDGVIFNETAIRQLGFQSPEEAVRQPVIWDESDDDQQSKQVIGVIKDFNQESLHKQVGPMVFALKKYLSAPWAGEYYSLKISTKDYPNALAQIQENWKEAFPNSPFDYFFLEEYFNHQYQADLQFGKIFGLFAGLAILIACLGLFGLSSYMTLQRTREIGIRKVLGASTQSVVTLLSKDFIRLIAVASAIILPVIYFVIKHWLENYAYRMEIRWWLLLLPVLLVWLLALVTISLQTIKTALANPVKSLRYE